MAYLIAMHKKPADSASYLEHYHERHVPLVKKLPGLQKFEASTGPLNISPEGDLDVFLFATLSFADVPSIHAALDSPEGKACIDDIPRFAHPGNVRILIFDSVVL